jgi:hypothetical protein
MCDAFGYDDSCVARENRVKIIRAVVLGYFLVMIAGVPELWFRWSGEEVTARVEEVHQDSKQRWHVKWVLESPNSGNLIRDQAIVAEDDLPQGGTIVVQFVDGIVPMSRPLSQAEPKRGWIFLLVQFSPLMLLGVFAIYFARECHRPMLTRQQRLVQSCATRENSTSRCPLRRTSKSATGRRVNHIQK